MTTRQASTKWLEIDRYLEAFEEAHATTGKAELAEFVPAADHPHYAAILCELVRVDLELAWSRGRPRPLEEYLAAFPCLAVDREALQQLTFEHYRQRGEHGEEPTCADYESRFGVNTQKWPPPPAAAARARGDAPQPTSNFAAKAASASNQIEQAAHAYEYFLTGPAHDDPSALRSFWASLPTPEGIAELFSDLHAADPQAAWHLARAATAMPNVGEAFLDFHLTAELGRGAFSRVYLARQMSLADRAVVLKVSTDLMGESRVLAQLQHTNIVPIYSAHHASPLQAVCMPFFGAATLADVLRELHGLTALPASGRHFLSTIHGRRADTVVAPSATPAEQGKGPERNGVSAAEVQFPLSASTLENLGKSTYLDAVLWLGARLADGLAHAHDRGIFHHDLKPANILLADDGQPMLLDFNLAEDTKLRNKAAAVRVGGTLPYMAPEQLEAFQVGGRLADGRSDLYSLGLILFELLTGQHCYAMPTGTLAEVLKQMRAERQQPPRGLRTLNPAVTPAVAAIVRHCLEPDPAARYQSAAQLREDLERQLAHRPLKHTAEPSLRERFRKWRRRHPRLTSLTSVCLVAALLLAGLGGTVAYLTQRLVRHQAREQMAAFLDEKNQAEVQARISGGTHGGRDEFREQAGRLLDRYQVRTDPRWLDQPAVRYLEPEPRAKLREEVGYLTFLLAVAEGQEAFRTSEAQRRQERLAEGIRLNDVALACFEVSQRPLALTRHREELHQLLHPKPTDAATSSEPAETSPRSARDAYLLAAAFYGRGKYAEALPPARQAAELAPRWFVAQFLLGNCHLELAQDARADQVFTTCIALWPEFAWSHYYRGLARVRLGQLPAARADFDRALVLKPDLTAAYVERAEVRKAERAYPAALADCTQALNRGASPVRIHLLRAEIRELAGDKAAAKLDREEGLRVPPQEENDWVARGLVRSATDPAGSLTDFDQALARNPRSREARQNKAYVLSELLRKVPESVAVLDSVLKDYPDYLPSLGGRAVLLARLGKRLPAHADAEHCLRLSKRPEVLYQVAGVYALTSREVPDDRREAHRLLAAAFAEKGYGLNLVDHDTDLDPIREQPEFRRLVTAARILFGAAKQP